MQAGLVGHRPAERIIHRATRRRERAIGGLLREGPSRVNRQRVDVAVRRMRAFAGQRYVGVGMGEAELFLGRCVAD